MNTTVASHHEQVYQPLIPQALYLQRHMTYNVEFLALYTLSSYSVFSFCIHNLKFMNKAECEQELSPHFDHISIKQYVVVLRTNHD